MIKLGEGFLGRERSTPPNTDRFGRMLMSATLESLIQGSVNRMQGTVADAPVGVESPKAATLNDRPADFQSEVERDARDSQAAQERIRDRQKQRDKKGEEVSD